jgi:hypothetical protein
LGTSRPSVFADPAECRACVNNGHAAAPVMKSVSIDRIAFGYCSQAEMENIELAAISERRCVVVFTTRQLPAKAIGTS